MDRRRFLMTSGAGLMAALAGNGVAFAAAPTEKRFVFIFLRGGLDGLHALAPYADADYRRLRPRIALERDAVIDLDGYFGLHTAMEGLMPLVRAGELAFVPAAATGYRERSHFDAQNMLENGSGVPYGARDGWLNRAILGLNAGDRRLGLSLGPTVPLILQGQADVQSWSNDTLPDVDADFLTRVAGLYQQDPAFADAFHDAQGAIMPDVDMAGMNGQIGAARNFPLSAQAVAALLAEAAGPRVAVMDLQGWDTHFAQPVRLRDLLRLLSEGLVALREGLGPVWRDTVVMVGSEFGRTAAENGNNGTDHGTGGLAMLAGGAVNGGRILGDWPGLSARALFEERDVLAVNAYESLFKSVLIDHLGLGAAYVEGAVFPNARGIAPMSGLLRV
ncbi:MAG: DUF1501 domain-containing protein [Rhodobacter sp.]|nr:DUF1501 domain-containing protein [Paracoccaceae bacterium]MCC0076810.1 DUF1501 domain-containing protein [Rhodobacter sp.]